MKTQLTLTAVVALLATAFACSLSAATLCVSLESTNPVTPYATWQTAATNIQDAVDAALAGDTVLVTNGVYTSVGVGKALAVRSVNGPESTVMNGSSSLSEGASLYGFTMSNGGGGCVGGGVSGGTVHNCVLTGNSAYWGGGAFGSILYNCTLKDNQGMWSGGADSCTLYNCVLTGNCGGGGAAALWSTLYNCVLSGNSDGGAAGLLSSRTIWSKWADSDCGGVQPKCGTTVPPPGGVVLSSTLYNCTLTGNSGVGGMQSMLYNCTLTENRGVGATSSTLYSCLVTGNSGGGVTGGEWGACTLYNSIIYYNSGGNYAAGTTLNYCCTSPLPTNGVGNIAGPPLFMDMAADDFRLREDSPCIDAGVNLMLLNVGYDYEATDILGNTRFIDGNGDGKVAWDIGACEFNSFPPPRFTVQPQRTSEGWTLNITGAPNKWVGLQRSGNLTDWEEIWSGFMWETNQQVTDADTGPGAMFYRVVVP